MHILDFFNFYVQSNIVLLHLLSFAILQAEKTEGKQKEKFLKIQNLFSEAVCNLKRGISQCPFNTQEALSGGTER